MSSRGKGGSPGGHDIQAEGLSPEEIRIITSTIDLRDLTVESVMIKYDDIFRLNHNDILDDALIKRISKRNYSRVPIFDEFNSCVGLIWTKQLINYEEIHNKKIRHAGLRMATPVIMAQNTNLLEALSIMEQKRVSMALIARFTHERHDSVGSHNYRSRSDLIVENSRTPIVGLVSLKDIFEKIVEKDFDDQDLHFRTIVSTTFGVPRADGTAVAPMKGDNQLIEMVEQTEHRHLKEPLVTRANK